MNGCESLIAKVFRLAWLWQYLAARLHIGS
jgi:hypothetical protein